MSARAPYLALTVHLRSIARLLFVVAETQFVYLMSVCLSVYLFVCLLVLPTAGQTAGPIKTKLGIGTHVDPESVLVKVKVKVIYRGPQSRDNRSSAINAVDRGPQGPRE